MTPPEQDPRVVEINKLAKEGKRVAGQGRGTGPVERGADKKQGGGRSRGRG